MNQRDIRSLDLGMLRTFDALMRERSVSRAAARLFLSQPAVSASLNRLRQVFDDPLFSRTSHGMVPTARACALAPQVEAVLASVASLLDEGNGFDPARSARIFRIAGSDFAGRVLLPTLVRRLAGCGSQIRIVWEQPGTSAMPERLRRGEFDLAVLARIRPAEDMRTLALYEDNYVYVTRHGHPQVGRPVTLDDFCATPQAFLGYGTSALEDVIDETLRQQGRERMAQVALGGFGQIVDLLQHSDMGAVIARRVADAYADQLAQHAAPFGLPTYRQLICWDARSDHDPATQWLTDEIRRIVCGDPAHAAA
ncbi:MAG: LysR family transcriptional regulator [Burkholderiales bacterium]|nr:LysR family transcriptional regulator [Burkholderiales bacterium]